MKTLKASDVTFSIRIESEDMSVRGRFATEIIDRLNRGDEWAWCVVIVTATWNDFSATDALGGCCYENEADFKRDGYYADMCDQALAALNAEIVAIAKKLEPLADPERWSNPWARDVVYVPIEELAACVDGLGTTCVNAKGERFIMTVETTLSHWRQKGPGERLDAYILPQADGRHCIGVRYGAEPSEYLSPFGERAKVAALLAKYSKAK